MWMHIQSFALVKFLISFVIIQATLIDIFINRNSIILVSKSLTQNWSESNKTFLFCLFLRQATEKTPKPAKATIEEERKSW